MRQRGAKKVLWESVRGRGRDDAQVGGNEEGGAGGLWRKEGAVRAKQG